MIGAEASRLVKRFLQYEMRTACSLDKMEMGKSEWIQHMDVSTAVGTDKTYWLTGREWDESLNENSGITEKRVAHLCLGG